MTGSERDYLIPILIAVVGHRDPQPQYTPQIIQQFGARLK